MDDKIPDHAAAIDWLDAIGFAGNIQSGVLRIGFPKLSDGFCNLAENLARAYVALAAFKVYVHRRLDEAGIPTDPESPHKAAGCRIGGRLDIALALTATVAELQAKVGKLEAECRTGDKILEMFQRLIAIFPECPDHGGCVPFAESAIAALRAENAELVKAQGSYEGRILNLKHVIHREMGEPKPDCILCDAEKHADHMETGERRVDCPMCCEAEARAIQQRREGKEKS